jgi:molecular chaperone GrpE (heat shock protein)
VEGTLGADEKGISEAGEEPARAAGIATVEPPPAAAASLDELKSAIDGLHDLFNARLRYDARKDETIQRLTDQMAVLSQEARDATIGPLLQDVILLRDSIASARKNLTRKESWTAAELANQFDVLLSEATELLERQDIVEWLPSNDRQLDRKFQRPVSTIPSLDPEADGQVVEVVRPGYTRRGNVFRPQEVVLAKHRTAQ